MTSCTKFVLAANEPPETASGRPRDVTFHRPALAGWMCPVPSCGSTNDRAVSTLVTVKGIRRTEASKNLKTETEGNL